MKTLVTNIRDEIRAFDHKCSAGEFTDTGEAWELLKSIENRCQAALKQTQYLIVDIRGVEMTLHRPPDPKSFKALAQAIRDEQDTGTDFIFALKLQAGALKQIPCPGLDKDKQ